jgi:hypothetical protein
MSGARWVLCVTMRSPFVVAFHLGEGFRSCKRVCRDSAVFGKPLLKDQPLPDGVPPVPKTALAVRGPGTQVSGGDRRPAGEPGAIAMPMILSGRAGRACGAAGHRHGARLAALAGAGAAVGVARAGAGRAVALSPGDLSLSGQRHEPRRGRGRLSRCARSGRCLRTSSVAR